MYVPRTPYKTIVSFSVHSQRDKKVGQYYSTGMYQYR